MERTLKLCKGGLISIAIFIVITILIGILLKFTSMPERLSDIYLIIALSLSCAFMGLYSGNLFGQRGLIAGLFFSTILLGVILIITALSYQAPISSEMFSLTHLIPLVCGACSGIVGTNMKN